MPRGYSMLVALAGSLLIMTTMCQAQNGGTATVPMILDHNRMLVKAEIQRKDGSWRQVVLWIDTGNPDFLLSESLARDLGFDLSAADIKTDSAKSAKTSLAGPSPQGVRIDGMPLNVKDVRSIILMEPQWLFATMHCDANLPSSVLRRYHVVFDYPARKVTLAEPGTLKPRGVRSPAIVNSLTGIIQIDADIAGENFSFALDNGASYSFISADRFEKLSQKHPDWPHSVGAVGCANIWGWWPEEPSWPIMRLPQIRWGTVPLTDVGLVGLPNFFANGTSLGEWYSRKAARPVDGFLGPNAFKAYRVEIDYADSAVYFEKGAEPDSHDLDIVGLTLRPNPDSTWQVSGIAMNHGKPAVEGVEPDDMLLKIGNVETKGATMGTVVDALRGRPGDARTLVLERNGKQFVVTATVQRFL